MMSNGHSKRDRDDGEGREERMRNRERTCAKRVGEFFCILDAGHERDGDACRGPHDQEPIEPVDEAELGGEGGEG
jgi:hypothetical protein